MRAAVPALAAAWVIAVVACNAVLGLDERSGRPGQEGADDVSAIDCGVGENVIDSAHGTGGDTSAHDTSGGEATSIDSKTSDGTSTDSASSGDTSTGVDTTSSTDTATPTDTASGADTTPAPDTTPPSDTGSVDWCAAMGITCSKECNVTWDVTSDAYSAACTPAIIPNCGGGATGTMSCASGQSCVRSYASTGTTCMPLCGGSLPACPSGTSCYGVVSGTSLMRCDYCEPVGASWGAAPCASGEACTVSALTTPPACSTNPESVATGGVCSVKSGTHCVPGDVCDCGGGDIACVTAGTCRRLCHVDADCTSGGTCTPYAGTDYARCL